MRRVARVVGGAVAGGSLLFLSVKNAPRSYWPLIISILLFGFVLFGPRKTRAWMWAIARRIGQALRAQLGFVVLTIPLITLVSFELLVGTYTLLRDLAVALLAWLLAALALRAMRAASSTPQRWTLPSPRAAVLFTAVFIVTCWPGIYILDFLLARPERPQYRDWSNVPNRWPKVQFGLALSGGGYRAALFHAGVLSALESTGVRVRGISTVSGGSIIGAFYASGGQPSQFLDLARQHRFNVRRELLSPLNIARIVVSARLPGTDLSIVPMEDFTRTDVQASVLDKAFLANVRLSDFHTPGAPEQVICTTDLLKGSLVGVFRGGLVVRERLPASRRLHFGNVPPEQTKPVIGLWLAAGELGAAFQRNPVSKFVAASGAFPGAFRPLYMKGIARHDSAVAPREAFVLADGGLADNLGTILLNDLASHARGVDSLALEATRHTPDSRRSLKALQGWKLDLLLVSDASAVPAVRAPRSTVSELVHAIDAIHRASGDEAEFGGNSHPAIPSVLLSPSTFISQPFLTTHDRLLLGAPDSFTDLWKFGFSRATPPYAASREKFRAALPTFPPSYQQLDMNDLMYLVARLSPSIRDSAQRLLNPVSLARELRWQRDSIYTELRGLPRGSTAAGALRATADTIDSRWRTVNSADQALFVILSRQLRQDIGVFLKTSTLDDTIEPEAAEALYRLGQYMVVLNRADILAAVGRVRSDTAVR